MIVRGSSRFSCKDSGIQYTALNNVMRVPAGWRARRSQGWCRTAAGSRGWQSCACQTAPRPVGASGSSDTQMQSRLRARPPTAAQAVTARSARTRPLSAQTRPPGTASCVRHIRVSSRRTAKFKMIHDIKNFADAMIRPIQTFYTGSDSTMVSCTSISFEDSEMRQTMVCHYNFPAAKLHYLISYGHMST